MTTSETRSFEERIIQLFGIIHPLDRIPRAGYLLKGVTEPESVAAHSHFVSLLALLVLDEYPGVYDRDKVLTLAIIHDLSEARLMDIPMPYADAYMAEAKERAEQSIIEHLFEGFPPHYAALHQELLDLASPEARLVAALDKVQMMLKSYYYEQENRGRMTEFWQNPKNFFDYETPIVERIFDALCSLTDRPNPKRR